jgi:hypothetical protein
MASPYRNKWPSMDNIPGSQREVYSVNIGAAGAVGNVRPSAGAGAVAGAGNLCTVARLATGVYQFTLTQNYYKVVGMDANVAVPFSTDGSTRAATFTIPSAYDLASNSFCVFVVNNSNALVDPTSGSQLFVEMIFIESVSPNTL